MSRYRGPRLKIVRRLKDLPGLTNKTLNPKKTRIDGDPSASRKTSQFCIRLEAKQRLRFNYGSTERQLLRYIRIARKAEGSTGQVSLQLLEMRLDNIVFRLGMAPTIPAARQLVNHRHIPVNNRIVDIPSYRCKPKDIIASKGLLTPSGTLNSIGTESFKRNEIPDHLTLFTTEADQTKGSVNGIVNRESIHLNINELLVVEYYSRKA
uniref:ribosomal protein S4 n=1 Tax=Lygodium flexuosum TaxID=85330 RepID=UPI002A823FE6|nr:ribosomal protein S4 [Lygodium flexuosum]UYS92461.1 ribosomal protein S4 [Lygodium flexuosum]